MKTRALLVALGLVAAALACTPPSTASRANLIGTSDLVLVDESEGGFLAGRTTDADGNVSRRGVPSRFLFLTSADTNELRVFENYRDGLTGRDFLHAPNPLETLSIPVLDRPTMLAADEGRNAAGARVTGSYVYAARPGGAEISVVSVARRRQLGGRPMATPAPVTALSAYMDVDQATPATETAIPSKTRVYVATWDGEFAAVYSAQLATDSTEIDHLDFTRQVLIDGTPITAMLLLAPLSTRTLDGAPFCAAKACLALATRGAGGSTFVLEPETGRSVSLSFSGPVRELVSSSDASRIYGILDEEACGGPSCGGVVAVDVLTATTVAGRASFPAALDALGLPMAPMRAGEGLITGLTLAAGATIQQRSETVSADGGASSLDFLYQSYRELGAFSSSTGVITFFSGFGGSIIDYDPRRSIVSTASVRLPGLLQDGGEAFVGEDGGVIGSNTAAVVQGDPLDLAQTWRTGVVTAGDSTWRWDLSDGYLESQSILFIYQGQIPGLVGLPTRSTDGVRLATGGFEVRAAAGDLVRFEVGDDAAGYRECGRTRIASIGSGFIEVVEVPPGCEGRVRFSVRAAGLKPLVVAADVEGYMGRWAPGETLTYSRPHVLLPAEVTAPRTALTVTIPPVVPTNEGAFTSFQILGHMTPYQVSLDTVALQACYTLLPGQVVMGNLVMDQVPTSLSGSSAIDFRWTLFGVVPSGNSLVELNLSLVRVGAVSTSQGAYCRR